MIDSFSSNESIVLLGDYGTGKTVVIQSVAEKLRNSDRDLVYINALDTTDYDGKKYYKTWEDVLDVINKLRFGSGVTVLDMGTLRRQYCESNKGIEKQNFFTDLILNRKIISVPDHTSVSTLKLLDDYIGNLANAQNTVVGVIQNIFHILISKYFRLSVTSFTYLQMTGRRSAMVRRLSKKEH